MTIEYIINLCLGSGVLLTAGRYILARIKANDTKTEAVCLGVQALLRDRLLSTYNKYYELGYAPIYVKENFENMWKQYHNLGQNGVMDELHDKFKELPTQKESEE